MTPLYYPNDEYTRNLQKYLSTQNISINIILMMSTQNTCICTLFSLSLTCSTPPEGRPKLSVLQESAGPGGECHCCRLPDVAQGPAVLLGEFGCFERPDHVLEFLYASDPWTFVQGFVTGKIETVPENPQLLRHLMRLRPGQWSLLLLLFLPAWWKKLMCDSAHKHSKCKEATPQHWADQLPLEASKWDKIYHVPIYSIRL